VKAIATYALKKDIISKLKKAEFEIKSTLRYPKDHKFIVGKPDIPEKIVEIVPVYSKLGPILKKESGQLIKKINEDQDKIIEKIENGEDIPLSEYFPAGSRTPPNESLIGDGYFRIKKEIVVKGRKGGKIIPFDWFYLEIQGE